MNSSRKSLRLVALAMCMALLLGLAAPAMAASIYAYGTVNANNTPVYSSTAKTATLGVFNLGDVVAVESQVSAQSLYVVRLGSSTTSVGYIAKSAVGTLSYSLKSGTTVASVKTSGTSTGSAGVIANCTNCNFRAAASNSSTKLGTLNKGTVVSVLATEGSFYKIVANGTTGYVSKTYVTITNTSGTTTTTSGTAGVIANCNSYVNFRATASATGTLLGTLSKGTSVTVIATEGSFYKIVANGKTGYVSKTYVSLTGTSTPTTTTPTTTTPTSGTLTGSGTYVTLRSKAASSYSTVARMKVGTAVTISSESGDYYKVTASGKTGYVPKSNVKTASTSTGTTTTTGTPGVIANCNSYVNFRATASATGAKLGTLSKGTAVTILGTEGSFTKITASGKTGYVSSQYVSASDSSAPTTTTQGTDTGVIALGSGTIKVEPYKSSASSTVKSKLAAAQKINSKTVGYINITGTNIQQPIMYYGSSNVHYYSTHDIYNRSSSSGVPYTFYGQMVRNNVVTGHNMRGSNAMLHQLHHIQEKTLGYTKCQTTDYNCTGSFSSVPSLTVAANRTWDISLFGYNKWEVWAMYETPANESANTLKYNINPLSSYSPSQIKTWVAYQKNRSEYKFNTAVSTDDVFLTIYTCGNNYDYASAQSRLYFFLKAVK